MREATCATCDGGPCPDHDKGRGCDRYVFRINRRSNMTCEGCKGRGWKLNEERRKDELCNECGGLGTEPMKQNADTSAIQVSVNGGDPRDRHDLAALIHELFDIAGISIGARARSFETTRTNALRLRSAGVRIILSVEPAPPREPTPEDALWKVP